MPNIYFATYRRKTRWELLRLCAVVAGIEFSYSAITAFSSPILLEMGVRPNFMSMVFSLSPLLGFFLSPICGSLSDRCTLSYGRRRIFIVVFSILELLGEKNMTFKFAWILFINWLNICRIVPHTIWAFMGQQRSTIATAIE